MQVVDHDTLLYIIFLKAMFLPSNILVQLCYATLRPIFSNDREYLSEDVRLSNCAINVGYHDFVVPFPQVNSGLALGSALVLGGNAEFNLIGAFDQPKTSLKQIVSAVHCDLLLRAAWLRW